MPHNTTRLIIIENLTTIGSLGIVVVGVFLTANPKDPYNYFLLTKKEFIL